MRRKRQTVELDETRGVLYDTDREDLKVKVYSGLYVNEASDLEEGFDNEAREQVCMNGIHIWIVWSKLNRLILDSGQLTYWK